MKLSTRMCHNLLVSAVCAGTLAAVYWLAVPAFRALLGTTAELNLTSE